MTARVANSHRRPIAGRGRRFPLARYLAACGVALLLGRAGLLVARDPCVGVADNLDYWRVARPAGIQVEPQKKQGYYVVCTYPTSESDLASLLSSAALIAWSARHLEWGLEVPEGRFDLRQLGLFYWMVGSALLLVALAVGLPAASALLLSWVLADPGFLLFFNSLYADPALIIGLLGTVCLVLGRPLGEPQPGRTGVRVIVLVLGALLAALAGFSKMQYSPFPAVLLLAWLLTLGIRKKRPQVLETAFVALLAAMALAAPALFRWGPAPRFLEANNYNAVYGGIARVATEPAEALAVLGLPEEHRTRPPKDYFAARVRPDDPVLSYLRDLSRVRLAWLYLRDPGALNRSMARIEKELIRVRTHPRGTYTREESGAKARTYRTPEQFSYHRTRVLALLPPRATWIGLVVVLVALAYRAYRRDWTAMDSAWLFLLLWLTSQMGVAVLGEGFVNLHQHLLGARLGLDLLIALVLARGLGALGRLRRAVEMR